MGISGERELSRLPVSPFFYGGFMSQKKYSYNYEVQTVRFYNPADAEKFKELCRKKNTNVIRAFNGLVKEALRTEHIPGAEV